MTDISFGHDGEAQTASRASEESKSDAFKRLAERRTNAVLDKIRILSNCANPYAYEWNDEDVRLIFGTIEQEVKLAKARFLQAQRSRRQFKLR
jgi:hypothetical protein